MPKYRVTVPVYHTIVVDADSESHAFHVAWHEKEWSEWECDDPQPDTTESDASIELEDVEDSTKEGKETDEDEEGE